MTCTCESARILSVSLGMVHQVCQCSLQVHGVWCYLVFCSQSAAEDPGAKSRKMGGT